MPTNASNPSGNLTAGVPMGNVNVRTANPNAAGQSFALPTAPQIENAGGIGILPTVYAFPDTAQMGGMPATGAPRTDRTSRPAMGGLNQINTDVMC